MRFLKRIAAACMAAALAAAAAVPAYAADFYREPANKKGILINSEQQVPEVVNLGASQVITNFPISWAYSSAMLNTYKRYLNAMDQAGITVTIIVLNDWAAASYDPNLLPVSAPADGANYYGFNTLSAEGVEAVRNAANIMAENFGGLVSNWVIGNEVNDGQAWNYIGQMDIDTYCSNYATGFRTWYDTLKASNSQARVFIPFDFRWNCGQVEGFKYGVMDMMPRLNALLSDTDYGIAWHAYPETFTDPVFSDDKYALNTPDTYIINLKNLNVLTDYMQQEAMLSPNGTVRHLILSEQGFTSDSPERGGECPDLQAACIKEAYETATANPYVEGFFLNRLQDETVLLEQHYAFGLIGIDAERKPAWYTYKELQ